MYNNGASGNDVTEEKFLSINKESSQPDESFLLSELTQQIKHFAETSWHSALESYQWAVHYLHWRLQQERYLANEAVAALLSLTLPLGVRLAKERGLPDVQLHYRTALSLAESYRLNLLSGQLFEALFKLSPELLTSPPSQKSPEKEGTESVNQPDPDYQLRLLTNALYHYEQAKQVEDCERITQQLHHVLVLASYNTLEPLLHLQLADIDEAQTPEEFNAKFIDCWQRLTLLSERLAQCNEPTYAYNLFASLLTILSRNRKLSVDVEGATLLQSVISINAYQFSDKQSETLFWQSWRIELAHNRARFIERFNKRKNQLEIFSQQEEFTQQSLTLLRLIQEDVTGILGPAPCDFFVSVDGSISRKAMTLYSDVEPRLLFKEKSARAIAYFNAFLQLFSYYLHSLGESDPDRPGLHLDAPNLMNEAYQPLLNTPEDFIAEWYPNDICEANNEALLLDGSRFAPLSGVLLYGNEGGKALFAHYQELLKTRLAEPAREGSTQTTAQYIALTCLRNDEEEYRILCKERLTDEFDIKSRFAKPLTAFCARLAVYHGIEERQPQQILKQLQNKIGFDADAADRLLWALAVIEGHRVVVQQKNACQKETLQLNEKAQTTVVDWTHPENTPFDLCLPALERDVIRPLYTALRPFLYPELQRNNERQQKEWQQTLERITQVTKPDELVVELAWPEIIVVEGEEEKPQIRLHQRYLRPEVARQLLDNKSQLRTDKTLYPLANHPVYRVVWGSEDIHVKRYPELPGIELAMAFFSQQFFGYCTPEVSVAKLTYQGNSEPLLVTQTVPGYNLSEMQKNSQRLKQIDEMNFTDEFFQALFGSNEDDKPDNRLLRAVFNREGLYRYVLDMVDRDHAFQEALITSWGRTQLHVKSVIYCCEQMKQPIDRKAAEHLVSLNIHQRLKNWLHNLITLDAAIYSLFDMPQLKTWMKRKALEKSTVPIFLDGVIIKKIYEKGCRLQRHLQQALASPEEPLPAPIELLSLIDPQLNLYYNAALSRHQTLWQRFDELTKHAYSRIVEGHHVSLMDSPRSKRSGLRVVPNEKDLFARRLYSPARCLELLEIKLQEQYQQLELCRQQLAQGDARLFEQETFSYFRELIINGLHFKKIPEETQVVILKTIAKTPTSFRTLSLHGCTALTDTLLLPLIKNSPHLWELDLSGCTGLTENIFTHIANYNKQIERLDVSGTNFKYIASKGFLDSTLTFLQLRVLITRDCKHLSEIRLIASHLTRWVARGCIQLREELIYIDSELSCIADLKRCASIADKEELILRLLYRLNVVKEFENYVERKLKDFLSVMGNKDSATIAKKTAQILATTYLDPIRRIVAPKDIEKFAECAFQKIKLCIKYGVVGRLSEFIDYPLRLVDSVRDGHVNHNFLFYNLLIFNSPIATQDDGNVRAGFLSEEERFFEDEIFTKTITADDIFTSSVPISVGEHGTVTYYQNKQPKLISLNRDLEFVYEKPASYCHPRYGFVRLRNYPSKEYYKQASKDVYGAIKNNRDHQVSIAIIIACSLDGKARSWNENVNKVEMVNALLNLGKPDGEKVSVLFNENREKIFRHKKQLTEFDEIKILEEEFKRANEEKNKLREEIKRKKEVSIVTLNKLIEGREKLNQYLKQVESRMAIIKSSVNTAPENLHQEKDEEEKVETCEANKSMSLLWQEYQKLTGLASEIKQTLQKINLDIAEINARIADLNPPTEEEHETPKKGDEEQEEDLTESQSSSPRLN